MRPDETDDPTDDPTDAGADPTPEHVMAEADAVPRRFRAWLAHTARRAGQAVVGRALVLWYAARDPDTPAAAKAVLFGGLAYLAEPIDAIPDLTPLLGYSDDMAVMGIALAAVTASIKPEHTDRAQARAADLFGDASADGLANEGEATEVTSTDTA